MEREVPEEIERRLIHLYSQLADRENERIITERAIENQWTRRKESTRRIESINHNRQNESSQVGVHKRESLSYLYRKLGVLEEKVADIIDILEGIEQRLTREQVNKVLVKVNKHLSSGE